MSISGIIVYWLQCLEKITSLAPGELLGEYADHSCSYWEKHQVCSKWNSLSRPRTRNESILPSLPFYSVRGDIDIHTSQQALCQFPSLIQICSEWSTNPSAVLAERMIARPVWRENYKSNTPGNPFSFRMMSVHRHRGAILSERSIFVFLCFLCAAYMHGADSCSLTNVHEFTWETLNRKHKDRDACLHYTFGKILLTSLTLMTLTFTLSTIPKLNLYPTWTNF